MGRTQSITRGFLFPLVVVSTGIIVYLNSYAGAFVFDDGKFILGNPQIRDLRALGNVLASRRPVVNVTLAVNYAISGENTPGYHAFNHAVHILAALMLFGIVRRTLLRGAGGDAHKRSASWMAMTVALIWVVHPLQTQSVTYIIQRGESLMGLFYLLTLYCVVRGVDSARPRLWYAGAVIACALGMGSKAVAITAPLVVLLYDRAFLSGSFKEALRRRWGLYTALAATWSVLAVCGVLRGVLDPSNIAATVGFGFKDITPLEYALTQPGVLVHYLRLSLWPRPLCIDYGWPVAGTAAAVVFPALVILGLLVLTVWALARKPGLGFLGAWFFLILLPTSSIVPVRDPLFEHRMYLPLAAVVVVCVTGAYLVLARVRLVLGQIEHGECHAQAEGAGMWFSPRPLVTHGRATLGHGTRQSNRARALERLRMGLVQPPITVGLVMIAVASLGYTTVQRNRVYRSNLTLWQDVVTKRPHNARGHDNLGDALNAAGRHEEAMLAFRNAVAVDPDSVNARCNLGAALLEQGRVNEAVRTLHEALRIDPSHANTHRNLGVALMKKGLNDEARREFAEAIRLAPHFPEAHYNLGLVLFEMNRIEEAVKEYQEALRLNPRLIEAHLSLAHALSQTGQADAAAEQYRQAIRLDPFHAPARIRLGNALMAQGRAAEAADQYRAALRVNPQDAGVYHNLGIALARQGNFDEAVNALRRAVQLQPDYASPHFHLANMLVEQGRLSEAQQEYRETLRLDPNHTGARTALENLSTRMQDSD